jgi:hypothetical protein
MCAIVWWRSMIYYVVRIWVLVRTTYTKNDDREYTHKRQQERERPQWKVIFYNTRTYSFVLVVFAIAPPFSVTLISGLNIYTYKKRRRDEETMKDGSSTFLFSSSSYHYIHTYMSIRPWQCIQLMVLMYKWKTESNGMMIHTILISFMIYVSWMIH